jgi:hypothetical protein
MPRYRNLGAVPGTTYGNHRPHFHRHLRASRGMVFAVQVYEPTCGLGAILGFFRLTSEGFVGSNPTAPTIFEYLIRRVIT